MPTNGDATGQAPTISSPDSNGQAPPVSHSSSDDSDNGASTSSADLSPDETKSLIEKLRKENAQRRIDGKRLAELEAAEQQRADAALSEKERYEKKIADLNAKLVEQQEAHKQQVVRSEVRSQAANLGIMPELALKLLNLGDITFNEDGDPTNVAELLASLVETYKLPVQAPGAQAQQPNQPRQQQPAAPQIGATNAPRQAQVAGQLVGKSGVFAPGEKIKLGDRRLYHAPGTGEKLSGTN